MDIFEAISIPGVELTAYADGETQQTTTQDAAAGTGTDAPQGEVNPVMSTIVSFAPMILIIVLLYFMMIRPQRKREKETKAMINALKVGDKVVSIGGICGKVSKIKDDFVIIETGNIGTQDERSFIKMERDSIKTVETKQSD